MRQVLLSSLGWNLVLPYSRPYDDGDICDLAETKRPSPDFLVGLTVDATQPVELSIRLVRAADGIRIVEMQVASDPQDLSLAGERVAEITQLMLVKHVGVRTIRPPKWYRTPTGPDFFNYLLRLEQQLAVTCMNLDFLEGGGLIGEHEILDGIIHLCVSQPDNELVGWCLSNVTPDEKGASCVACRIQGKTGASAA